MGLSEQVAELTAAQADLKEAISALSARMLAKLAELQAKIEAAGEPDPDLSANIQDLKDDAAALAQIGA